MEWGDTAKYPYNWLQFQYLKGRQNSILYSIQLIPILFSNQLIPLKPTHSNQFQYQRRDRKCSSNHLL